MVKLWRSVLVSLALGSATLGPMAATQAATGLVRIRVVNVGFILGAGGGQGALSLHGRVYPFSVGGIGVGTFGASAAELVGRAYNLRSPYDLVGSYTAVGAGLPWLEAFGPRDCAMRMAPCWSFKEVRSGFN